MPTTAKGLLPRIAKITNSAENKEQTFSTEISQQIFANTFNPGHKCSSHSTLNAIYLPQKNATHFIHKLSQQENVFLFCLIFAIKMQSIIICNERFFVLQSWPRLEFGLKNFSNLFLNYWKRTRKERRNCRCAINPFFTLTSRRII